MSLDLIIVTCYLRSQLLLKILIGQHFHMCRGGPRKLGFILNLTIAQELRDNNGQWSSLWWENAKDFVLSSGGSLTMIKKCCSLWLAF